MVTMEIRVATLAEVATQAQLLANEERSEVDLLRELRKTARLVASRLSPDHRVILRLAALAMLSVERFL